MGLPSQPPSPDARTPKDRRAHALIVALALAHMAAALVVVLTREVVDDEGYLAFTGARVLLEAPAAAFFAQKLHPVTSLLQAPAAALGWWAWLAAHAIASGLSVVLLGHAVQRLGGRGPLAAFLLAASPALIVSAAAGQSNVDGVLLVSAALFAAVLAGVGGPTGQAERPALRARAAWVLGLLLGMAAWTRAETVLGAAVLGGYALWRVAGLRGPLLAGAATFPLLYLLGGSVYHGDPLFALHYPPNVTQAVPLNDDIYDFPTSLAASASAFALSLAWVCGAWPLVLSRRWSRSPAFARLGLGVTLTLATAMVLVPLTGGFFDHPWPRYLLVLLPWLALTMGLVVRHRALAWVVVTLTLVTAAWTLPTPQVRWRLGYVAPTQAEARTLALLRADRPQGRVVTTSMRIALALHLDDVRAGTPPRVVFLPGHDVQLELYLLLNHRNGQFRDLTRAFARVFFGQTVWSCGVEGLRLSPADRLVVGTDPRRQLLLPDADLAAVATQQQVIGDALSVWQPTGGQLRPHWPSALPEAAYGAFCAGSP